jgi:hypothetical protein
MGRSTGTGGGSGFGSQTVSQPFNWAGTIGGLALGGASLANQNGWLKNL